MSTYIYKQNPTRSKAYTDFVKSLDCCSCGAPGDDPHHVVDCGLGGAMGGKASDLHTIPLCRRCHNLLHHDVEQWEVLHDAQAVHVLRTQALAEARGLLMVRSKGMVG